MVKLATAREARTYGPRRLRNRWEYTNAGLHVFSAALLAAGFSAQLLGGREAGLAVVLVALAVLALVNAHDLVAHLAGVDFRLGLVRYDLQLGLVELAVPLLLTAASAVTFLGILFLLIQASKSPKIQFLNKFMKYSEACRRRNERRRRTC